MTNSPKMPVRNPDIIRETLRELHDTSGLGWREIARLGEFIPIPAGTLAAIAKGYPVPKKWYARLGLKLYLPAPACDRCGQVHVSKRCPNRPRHYRDLWDMPVTELRRRLKQRTIYD